LTMGVLRAMWIAKVKVVGAAVLAVAALGAGVAYHSEAVWAQQVAQASPAKPRSELEALRRENELLKLNLEVVLEKVRAQESELRTLRGKPAARGIALDGSVSGLTPAGTFTPDLNIPNKDNRLGHERPITVKKPEWRRPPSTSLPWPAR